MGCRSPSADEWIRKLWYIYIMEYYSAINKNTFESVLMRWMKLEPIIQSEVMRDTAGTQSRGCVMKGLCHIRDLNFILESKGKC